MPEGKPGVKAALGGFEGREKLSFNRNHGTFMHVDPESESCLPGALISRTAWMMMQAQRELENCILFMQL